MTHRLVVLADYSDALVAHSVRILLEASGVEAHVTGDTPSEHGLDRAQVLVRQADLELARQIVTEVPPASEILIPEWICVCGETVDEGFHRCWACGLEHPDSE